MLASVILASLLLTTAPPEEEMRLLPNAETFVDAKKVDLQPVRIHPNGCYVSARKFVRAVSLGGFTLAGDKDRQEIRANNKVVAQFRSEGDTWTCKLSLSDGSTRTVKVPDAFETIGGELMMDPAALGPVFGVSVRFDDKGFQALSPIYWNSRLALTRDTITSGSDAAKLSTTGGVEGGGTEGMRLGGKA